MQSSIVDALLNRQRNHPAVDEHVHAAKVHDINLFIGDAVAAEDTTFLHDNSITSILSICTDTLAIPDHCDVLHVAVLDIEEEVILEHLQPSIEFIDDALAANKTVLVHCVYGQSRSAAMCVAYLMHAKKLGLVEAYDVVQEARNCIYINKGFLHQLELFENMTADPDLHHASRAHAVARLQIVSKARKDHGDLALTYEPATSGRSLCCRKCRFIVGSESNQIPLDHTNCQNIYLEVMPWMSTQVYPSSGKLQCPKCQAKLGLYNWYGMKCSCGRFVSSAFQLTSSRVEFRR